MASARFHIDDLRIDPADHTFAPAAARARKKRWRRKFVRVPWAWVDRLKSTRHGATYRLALILVYEHWRTGGRPVRLSNVLVTGDGLSRYAKSRALKQLERLGLVLVERRRKASPIVTLLLTDPSDQ